MMFQKSLIFAIILTLFGCDSVTTVATVPQSYAKVAGGPIVVELFQSQGCSSCPPTNAAFNLIADRADLIPLSFAVTYWDNLGWKDRFAKPAFTQRQRDYAKTLRVGAGVYTPQVVINGAREPGLRGAVLVQDMTSGQIVAATRLPPPR